MNNTQRISLAALTVAAATVAAPRPAAACGGCFTAGGQTESTVVTGHRMAMSISQTQTVLWDQFEYAGNPEEFSWVLPVKAGAYLEIAQDAWFDVLDAGTATAVGSRQVSCSTGGSGFGCGASADAAGAAGPGSDPVTVVSQGTVGPYETVTLSTDQPGALNEWLDSHGYTVPESIQPTIDEYVAEDFDFIALRLIPGNGVQQMQPVRVIMPAGQMALPLRLVAAGTGANTALTLFVIGEGRYEVQNFPNLLVDRSQVVWDYNLASSNYSELRADALERSDGLGWLTTYALPDTFFDTRSDNALEFGGTVTYRTGQGVASTLADAYVQSVTGVTPGGFSPEASCANAMRSAAQAGLTIVDNCDEEGLCAPLEGGEISRRDLDCGEADDLAVALTGMHLGDVWITRLEAELPRTAFASDLVLQAASDQAPLDSRFIASTYLNHPCGPPVTSAALLNTDRPRRIPGGAVALVLGGLGLALMMRRRREDPQEQ